MKKTGTQQALNTGERRIMLKVQLYSIKTDFWKLHGQSIITKCLET